MPCEIGEGVVVCRPPRGVYHRLIRSCPVCERRHRFIVRWDGAWYGTTLYGSCGDSWQDGGLGCRPFQRGWRKKAQARFREMWEHAAPRDLYDAYVDADVRMAISPDGEWEKAADDRDSALAAIHAAQGA